MAYQAQAPNLFDNVGGPTPPREHIDVAGAVSAIGDAAGSYIHQAYLRRQAANQAALNAAASQRQIDQEQRDEARRDQQFTASRADADRDYQLRQTTEAHRALEAGVTPGSPGGATASIAPPPVTTSPSIAQAMASGLNSGTPATSSLAKPVDVGTLPTVNYGTEAPTPDQFDPTKSAAYVRSTETAKIRGEMAKEASDSRSAAMVQGRNVTGQYAVEAAKIRANAPGKSAAIRDAMTGNAKENYFEKVVAPGLLAAHGNSLQDATDNLLSSDEGKKLVAQGFTVNHLAAEYSKQLNAQTKGALTLQSGALGMTPQESAGAVKTTRQLMSGGGSTPTAPAPPASAAAPAAPVAGRLTAPTAASAPAGKWMPTDEETMAAMQAGKTTPDDVRAYTLAQRKKKSGAK